MRSSSSKTNIREDKNRRKKTNIHKNKNRRKKITITIIVKDTEKHKLGNK